MCTTTALMSSTANMMRRMPSVFTGASTGPNLIALGVWNLSSSMPCPSGVRIMARVARTSLSPIRLPTEGPSTVVSPSSLRPSSMKNALVASRSSTTIRTLSIRLTDIDFTRCASLRGQGIELEGFVTGTHVQPHRDRVAEDLSDQTILQMPHIFHFNMPATKTFHQLSDRRLDPPPQPQQPRRPRRLRVSAGVLERGQQLAPGRPELRARPGAPVVAVPQADPDRARGQLVGHLGLGGVGRRQLVAQDHAVGAGPEVESEAVERLVGHRVEAIG